MKAYRIRLEQHTADGRLILVVYEEIDDRPSTHLQCMEDEEADAPDRTPSP